MLHFPRSVRRDAIGQSSGVGAHAAPMATDWRKLYASMSTNAIVAVSALVVFRAPIGSPWALGIEHFVLWVLSVLLGCVVVLPFVAVMARWLPAHARPRAKTTVCSGCDHACHHAGACHTKWTPPHLQDVCGACAHTRDDHGSPICTQLVRRCTGSVVRDVEVTRQVATGRSKRVKHTTSVPYTTYEPQLRTVPCTLLSGAPYYRTECVQVLRTKYRDETREVCEPIMETRTVLEPQNVLTYGYVACGCAAFNAEHACTCRACDCARCQSAWDTLWGATMRWYRRATLAATLCLALPVVCMVIVELLHP
jgi:hypothetical protein